MDGMVEIIISLIIVVFMLLLDLLAKIFFFKKAGVRIWKAFVPIYSDLVGYKAAGMSALWTFSQIPNTIISLPGLKVPVWLTGLCTFLNYGGDFIFAINLTRAFHRKYGFMILSVFFPTLMELIISVSKKSEYDHHFNHYEYRKVGDKFVKLKDVKKERKKLLAAQIRAAKKELLSEPEPPEKTGFLKKITDFLVVKHKAVLTVILILTAICGILSTKVNVNRDLTKYMPESSETAQGLNIMYNDFEQVLAMPLSVMVSDLSDEEKQSEKAYLEKLDGVTSITYNNSEEYNKDNKTLYELTIAGKADSDNAANALKTIQKHYSDLGKSINIRGEVATMNAPVLPLWVIAIAVISALIILIIMAESYVEPVLYLVAIGLAVGINMGTNAFLPSVSQITNSITSVLQLALSMDYSIMLATEFHREKLRGKSKIPAMKAALSRSFVAISASSVTTIAGMLVLILMSFTIGADLGIVLAKGVLLCLLSIFTALPALLLIFDNLIEKTRKTAFKPNLNFLGIASYKIRHFAIPIFLLVMGGSFYAQLSVGNLYTNTESEAIDEVFGPYNQTVLVYNREDEEKVTNFCKNESKNEKTTSVLCYGNTINEPQKSTELLDKFTTLGNSVNIPDELIRFIYYHYYDQDENHQLSLKDTVSFLQNEGRNSEILSKQLSEDVYGQLDRLAQFTEPDNVNRWRSLSEISKLLDIPYSSLKDLMVLYASYRSTSTTLTLQELSSFIKSSVLTNPSYSSAVPESTRDKLDLLDFLIEIAEKINKDRYNKLVSDVNISIDDILDEFDISEKSKRMIKTKLAQGKFAFSAAVNKTPLSAAEISKNLGVDKQSLNLLYALYDSEHGRGIGGISLYNLIDFLHNKVLRSSYASRLSSAQATQINAIYDIIHDAATPHNATDLYNLLAPLSDQISADKLGLLLIYHGSIKDFPEDMTMTIEQVVNFLNDKVLPDSRLETAIDADSKEKIINAKNSIANARDQLISEKHGRVIIRTKLPAEGEETFDFVKQLRADLDKEELSEPAYFAGNSPMAYEMSQSFSKESVIITIVTAIVIYVVVAFSFKSLSIPLILVAMIQTAVWITMTITGMTDGSIYFLSLIIVQSLLMGATIDYAIMYTEQYVAARERKTPIKDAVVTAYNKSIQAILTSAGVLTIVTAIVGNFASSTAAKICKAISDGTFFSTLLILLLLPALMAACDKLVIKKKYRK